jgi:hypothetical protein
MMEAAGMYETSVNFYQKSLRYLLLMQWTPDCLRGGGRFNGGLSGISEN